MQLVGTMVMADQIYLAFSHFGELITLNSKETGTIPCYTWPHDCMKPTWGQLCRSKTRVKKLY